MNLFQIAAAVPALNIILSNPIFTKSIKINIISLTIDKRHFIAALRNNLFQKILKCRGK